jgi:hypothetical protein
MARRVDMAKGCEKYEKSRNYSADYGIESELKKLAAMIPRRCPLIDFLLALANLESFLLSTTINWCV